MLVQGVIVCLIIAAVLFLRSGRGRKFVAGGASVDARSGNEDNDGVGTVAIPGSSMLKRKTVQSSLAGGAPPIPWMLRREDREAMTAIEAFFSRAIPNPTVEGRAFTKETQGHGGPQLELYVPILSSRRPVAMLARSWDSGSEALESSLFIFGAVDGRLADVVSRAGFERPYASSDGSLTVFRNRRGIGRQRSA